MSLGLSLPPAQALAREAKGEARPRASPDLGPPRQAQCGQAQGPSPAFPPHPLVTPFSLLGFSIFPMSEGSGHSSHPKPQPWLLSGLPIPLVFILRNEKFQQKPKAGAPGSPCSPHASQWAQSELKIANPDFRFS